MSDTPTPCTVCDGAGHCPRCEGSGIAFPPEPEAQDNIPRRRLRLVLDLGADDLDRLCDELRRIANELELEGREEVPGRTSGGYSAAHHFTLTCDAEQTAERFREQLNAWTAERRAARAAHSPSPVTETGEGE